MEEKQRQPSGSQAGHALSIIHVGQSMMRTDCTCGWHSEPYYFSPIEALKAFEAHNEAVRPYGNK